MRSRGSRKSRVASTGAAGDEVRDAVRKADMEGPRLVLRVHREAIGGFQADLGDCPMGLLLRKDWTGAGQEARRPVGSYFGKNALSVPTSSLVPWAERAMQSALTNMHLRALHFTSKSLVLETQVWGWEEERQDERQTPTSCPTFSAHPC